MQPQNHEQQLRYWIGQKLMIDLRHLCDDMNRCEDLTHLPQSYAQTITDLQLGGVILFANNLKTKTQIQTLTTELHHSSSDGLPLLIGVDQEGGRVARLPQQEYPAFAGAMAIGATLHVHGPHFAQEVANAIAHQLRELGINLNFAPTVDINNNALNPVINVRSFGDSPSLVSKAGSAMVQGMQQQGVWATLKHFPGHGDTHVDSHTGLPSVQRSQQEVEEVELAPFQEIIAKSNPAFVMTAHIQYPALDNSQLVNKQGLQMVKPATLSRKILTGILRERMNYPGLIITDALNMAGISQFFEPTEAVIQTFAAGADIALMPYEIRSLQDLQQLSSLIDGVVLAVKQGRLSEDELQRSANRVIKLRQKSARAPLSSLHLDKRLQQDLALEAQLAQASLTLVGNNQLPSSFSLANQRILILAPESTKCQGWLEALKWHDIPVEAVQCATLEESSNALHKKIDFSDVILGSLITPSQSAAELGVLADLLALTPTKISPLEQKRALKEAFTYAKSAQKNTILVSMRTPYELEEFTQLADVRLATYSYNQQPSTALRPLSGPAYDAVVGYLLGKFSLTGTLPVSLNQPNPKVKVL